MPFPTLGNLTYPGTEPASLVLAGRFFTTLPPKTSNKMVFQSDEREHSCFVDDLKVKTLNLSPLSMILRFKFFIDAPFQVEELFFSSYFVENFYLNECWIQLNAFPASIEIIVWLYSLNRVLYISYCSDDKPILYYWDKFYMIKIYNSFYMFLDSFS